MSEIANSEGASESEKPVHNDVQFPPFPDPTNDDFDDDISEEERNYYRDKFKDLNTIKSCRLHCTACDRHMGCSTRNERMRAHPLLRTLVCHSCHTFYNSGEFEKGDDGSELYCRWCGQGGQVYCCSDCPHVFCAKCIKRNLGIPKIKEIENADDWKCFKCNPECLRDLRAICWAVLRYCDLKNKITYQTEDAELKSAYQKDCALDLSECCKHKTNRRNQKINDSLSKKKEVKKETDAKVAANIISKIPPTIQVKKFASLPIEENSKIDKKAHKRPASPKPKPILVKNPISIAPCQKVINPVGMPPLAKKIRIPSAMMNTPIRFSNIQERKPVNTYTRIRPKMAPQLPIPIANNCFNGRSNNVFQCGNPVNDNINLSLESLTQGLDMAAVAALSNNSQNENNDVICTPDFPLEPLCEVTEDNDDDVQCITPAPSAAPKVLHPPPLVPRTTTSVTDVNSENIIQMTDNDVTVNEITGALKFRVDPQTLSSNKMYRLPDGRIFAINANPNMPGGYSATIVAVTEANKGLPKGSMFAAKLSSVSSSTPNSKSHRNQVTRFINSKQSTPKIDKRSKTPELSTRECDLNVPVEWYRYNLIDAVDALEYSLSRLHKLKKEATSVYLRTRSINEMRSLHRTLERLLSTSSSRFNEIRENLNKGLKQYVLKKSSGDASEDDDDVEILPNVDDDPISIDENSNDSYTNDCENQEVDLTGPGSSEFNDSSENRTDNFSQGNLDPMNVSDIDNDNSNTGVIINIGNNNGNFINIVREDKGNCSNDNNPRNGTGRSPKSNAMITLVRNDLNCAESFEGINGAKTASPGSKIKIFKNVVEENHLKTNSNVKADEILDSGKKQETDGKMQDSDEKLEDSNEKLQDSNEKTQDSNEKTQDSNEKMQDSNEKMQDSYKKEQDYQETRQDSDEKMQDSDEKMQDANEKMQDSGEKIQDSDETMQDSGEKMQDFDEIKQEKIQGSDEKIPVIDEKILASDLKIQGPDAITEDSHDKIQLLDLQLEEDEEGKVHESEMSEEMIETLLKDDNSRDNTSTNSEPAQILQVTQ